MLTSKTRKLAAKVADLLETTYVPRTPLVVYEECALSATMRVGGSSREGLELRVALARYVSGGSVARWSDTAGKEEVIRVFRHLAEHGKIAPL